SLSLSLALSSSCRTLLLSSSILPRPPISTLFPYTTLFRSVISLKMLKLRSFIKRTSVELTLVIELVTLLYIYTMVYLNWTGTTRSEEHTSELQSRFDLVCRLLLEKKNKRHTNMSQHRHKND